MKQKRLGAFNIFFLIEKNWLLVLHILWCPIHKSSEILTFYWNTLYNCVIGNQNSEQLVLGQEWKSKIVIFMSDEAENFGGIQHFGLTENNWFLYILSRPIQKSSEKLMFSTRKSYV